MKNTVIKYILYLGMSSLLTYEVWAACTKRTPLSIALLVFSATNWLWVYKLTTREEE